MKHALYLTLGAALLVSAPACAQTFYPGAQPIPPTAFYPGPAAELQSGMHTTVPQPNQAVTAANLPAASGNVVPNGPLTANPPGAGAASADTLREHGETGTNAVTQNRQ